MTTRGAAAAAGSGGTEATAGAAAAFGELGTFAASGELGVSAWGAGGAGGADTAAAAARGGITGGRDGSFPLAPGDDLDSLLSAAGKTEGFERIGGGGGSLDRMGAGGALTFAGAEFAARLLRTGGGGGAERGAPEREPGFAFFFDSPSSAISEERA
jgi:hypothetical protein